MKTNSGLLVAGMLAVLCCSIGNAQVSYSNSLYGATLIYSHSFDGGTVDINGTAPTYINPNASSFGGTTSALFDVVTNSTTYGYYAYQDGTVGPKQESVLLPFTPVSGYVYTLSASLTFAIQPPGGGWGALGYGANFPPSNGSTGDPRFNQGLVYGRPWALLNYAAQGGGAILYDTYNHASGGVANLMTALNTPYTINFVVDTTATPWRTALFVAGTFVKDFTYTANPTIRSIGYGQTATTAGAYRWNSLTLSASPLVITKQPVSATVAAGTAFTNTVVVAAVAPSYQWFTNDVPISGATNASLILNPVTAANACANYYVVITNSLGGAATSAPVSLVVVSAPTIAEAYPVTYTNLITLYGGTSVGGTDYPGSTPTFSVSVIGQEPLYYQWRTNGVAVGGATNTSFTFTNCPLNGPTSFACVVTNFGGSATQTWSVSYLPSPTASFPKTVLEYNPVGFWRLNEGPDDGNGDNGVIASDYMSGNNGIYTNAVLGYTGYTGGADPTEWAARFNYFGVPSDVFGIQRIDFSAAAGTSRTFSVQAWVNGSVGQTSGAGIIAKGYNGGEQFALDVNGNKYRFVARNAGGAASSVTALTGPDGNWHFIVGVCDEIKGVVTLYVDGRLAGSASIASGSGVFPCAAPVTIGARGSSASQTDDLQFDGYLNDLAIYNYALSDTQVATLYSAAGYTLEFGFVAPLPPTNAVFLTGGTLTIPATVFGAAPIGYYWTNLTTGVAMGAGGSSVPGNLDATLIISNAPVSLSGNVLELVVTNATDSTNWFTTLFSPAPPIALDYSSPILYSNYFNGGTGSISGMPMTAANSLVGGTNTTWVQALGTNDTGTLQANGVDTSTLGDSWLLPFIPRAGYVYTLTASLTFSGNPNNWVGLGFAQRVPTNAANGYGRYSDGGATPPQQGPNGYDWIILTESSGSVQYFTGPGGTPAGGITNGVFFTPGPGTHTVTVVLDTTGAQWKYSASVDGNSTLTYTYSSNPPIGAVGITQTALTTPGFVQWNYFSLSQVAPAGVPPYLFAPLPPTSVTLRAGTSLSIPVSAFGSVPVGYYWSNTNTAAVLGSGATNNLAPLSADLAVSNVPFSWNGNTLALIVTNTYGTNISLVSLSVTNSINPNPTKIVFSAAGGQLTLSWPEDYVGWQLQSNSVALTEPGAWFTVAGSTTTNQITIMPDASQRNVFYRMFLPQP